MVLGITRAQNRSSIPALHKGPIYSAMMASEGHAVPAYAYSLNNPLTNFDPDGRATEGLTKADYKTDWSDIPNQPYDPFKPGDKAGADCRTETVPNPGCASGMSRVTVCVMWGFLFNSSQGPRMMIPDSRQEKGYHVRCVDKSETKEGVMCSK